jgi:cytochrome c oxidase subunit 4
MHSSIPSVRSYIMVFSCLVVLTLLTTGVALAPIGSLHTPIGLVIAICKAILVVIFFMHLLHGGKVSWVMIGAAFFMLFVMLYLTLADYYTRPAMGKWETAWGSRLVEDANKASPRTPAENVTM